MSITTGSDREFVSSLGNLTMSLGEGDDLYVIDGFGTGAATRITINDSGTNRIQLTNGLTIKSSLVASNTTLLTLSNDAQITISNAASFTFIVGGTPGTGVGGTTQTYTEFATVTLGAPSVPPTGSTSGGSGITIGTPTTPTFSVSGATTAAEGTSATFTVTLSGPAQTTAKTVTYTLAGTGGAVLGTDTGASTPAGNTGTLTFAPGVTTQTVVVPISTDASSPEAGEGVSLTLSAPSAGTTLGTASVTTTITDVSSSGQTYTLTTGQDNIPGTSGNDTILGVSDNGAASNSNTLTAGDVINGGDGKDSLYATLEAGTLGANTGVLPISAYSNLENFFIRNVSTVSAANTFNFVNVTGEEQVWNDRSNAGSNVTVTNLAAGTTLGVKGAGTIVSATNATYVAGASEAKIALDGGLAATGVGAATGAVTVANAPGSISLLSATVTSTNGSNNIGALNLAGTETALTVDAQSNFAITDANAATLEGIGGAALKTITVKGAGSANLGSAALPALVTTVDAAQNSGGVTAVLSAAATANSIQFTGGTGNDVVSTNGGGLATNLLTTAKVDAGAGTADRLVVTNTADITIAANVLSKSQGDIYKGFEQVQVQDGVSLNVTLLATNNTIDAVRINDGVGVTGVTNVSATGAQNVTILAANSAVGQVTIGVAGATSTGQIDTVKAAVTTTTAAGVAQNINLTNVALAGVENLELTGSNGTVPTNIGFVTLETASAIDLASIKLSNANAVDTNTGNDNLITINAANQAINLNIDATGSGDTQINAGAYNTVTGAKLTAGAGNDIITPSLRADVLTGGAGSDTLILSNNIGNAVNSLTPVVDTINDLALGAGNDIINLSGLANNLRPLQYGAVSSTLVSSLTSALPAGATGAAELIVLDSSVAALQAANASALNDKLFNLAGSPNQGSVAVAYSDSASGDVRLAVAIIVGGDITNVIDLAVDRKSVV